jgi:hypothetical protein
MNEMNDKIVTYRGPITKNSAGVSVNDSELGISVLSYSIFISWSYAFFVLNLINSVLEKYRNSKLVLNHNFNLLRTSVTLMGLVSGNFLLCINDMVSFRSITNIL